MGITREISLLNGTEIEHNHRNIWSPLPNISLYYTVSIIGLQLNCVFVAKILDYFKNSKVNNKSYFSEYNTFD